MQIAQNPLAKGCLADSAAEDPVATGAKRSGHWAGVLHEFYRRLTPDTFSVLLDWLGLHES